MSSLADTYDNGPLGAVWDKRQLLVAVGLFSGGVVSFVVAILAAATDIFTELFSYSVTQSWEVAGILAGFALPMMIVGVFTIMPASPKQRVGAAIGLFIAIVGVFMFTSAFPHQWHGDATDHTFRVLAVYFTGTIITVAYLFVSIANFKQRNDPGGNVTLNMDIDGKTQSVSVSPDELTEKQRQRLNQQQQSRSSRRLSNDD